MPGDAFLYAAALLVSVWGVAHLVPTRAVVAGFGTISTDNRRVLTMEWVAEAVTMLFVGALLAAVTLADGDGAVVPLVYGLSAAALAAIAVLTAFTGARTPVVWFKACPFVMATCIALILVGSML
jgi:hypothetical protein